MYLKLTVILNIKVKLKFKHEGCFAVLTGIRKPQPQQLCLQYRMCKAFGWYLIRNLREGVGGGEEFGRPRMRRSFSLTRSKSSLPNAYTT